MYDFQVLEVYRAAPVEIVSERDIEAWSKVQLVLKQLDLASGDLDVLLLDGQVVAPGIFDASIQSPCLLCSQGRGECQYQNCNQDMSYAAHACLCC